MTLDELTIALVTSNVEIGAISRYETILGEECETIIANWIMVIASVFKNVQHIKLHLLLIEPWPTVADTSLAPLQV